MHSVGLATYYVYSHAPSLIAPGRIGSTKRGSGVFQLGNIAHTQAPWDQPQKASGIQPNMIALFLSNDVWLGTEKKISDQSCFTAHVVIASGSSYLLEAIDPNFTLTIFLVRSLAPNTITSESGMRFHE